jgi:guanylate kinase
MGRKGQLFVISAPSGTGKSTLCNMLLSEFGNISYSVSHTTRPPRNGEINGVHYNFVEKDDFNALLRAEKFLECAEVHGNMYVTSKKNVEESILSGRDILLDIDTQGALNLKSKLGYGVFIFIAPPSVSELKKRLERRNDTPPNSVRIRLENAKIELTAIPSYDYLIVNDRLKETYEKLRAIYIAEILRTALII